MSRVRQLLPWVALWLGFVAFGLWIRTIIPWFSDVEWLIRNKSYTYAIEYNGYDYTRYGQMLSGFHMIFYAAFRHPLYGILMSPVIIVASRLRELGEWPMWCWFFAFFSTVMTLATHLVVRLTRMPVAGVLFASFAVTWVLAATPESFGLSCLIALVVLWWAQRPKGPETLGGWCLLGVLAGGITSTQAIKVAIAFLLTNKVSKKILLIVGGLLVAAGLLVVVYFVLRVLARGDDLFRPLKNITYCLFVGKKSFCEWLGEMWVFFSEPIVTRGEPLSRPILSWRYADPVRPLLAAVVLVAGVVSAWITRHELLTKLIAAMFLIEVLLHFVLVWGMEEAQLYAGHWVYAIPIMIGLALKRLPEERRRLGALLVRFLASAVFAANVLAWVALSS